jgi:hypothetical protein
VSSQSRLSTIPRSPAAPMLMDSEEFDAWQEAERRALHIPDPMKATVVAQAKSSKYNAEPEIDNPKDAAILIDGVDITTVAWLWRRRIPLGYITILDGEPDKGKSTLSLDLASRVSTGAHMPDGTNGVGPAGVVLWSVEDGMSDVIKPRLLAAGADCKRIAARALAKLEDGTERTLTVDDIARMRRDVAMVDAKLIVIDPMSAYMGKANSHNDAEVRNAFAPMQHLAEELGVSIVLIRHLNKAVGGNAMSRGMGSIAGSALARSVLLVARESDEPDAKFVLARIKGNLSLPAESLLYTIDGDPDDEEAAPHITWHGVSDKTANELVAAQEPPSKLRDAENFVRDYLAYGPVKTDDLGKAADREGISRHTLRRAKEAVGVVSKPDGIGAWMSSLPKDETTSARAPF